MNLHDNPRLYSDIIDAAGRPEKEGGMGIIVSFIEKDYWITRALKLMTEADVSGRGTFKGGTSLTKCYSIGNRFSEDVDVAVSEAWTLSSNQLKTLIRRLSKAMSEGLKEVTKPTTSKGSRYHKAYYAYPGIADYGQATAVNTAEILVEINSFANPYPREKRPVSSFIHEFLKKNGAEDIIDKYGLEPFEVNVLDKRRTFTEKMVSLFRASLAVDSLQQMRAKIRHFYDLHYLWNDAECREYILGNLFMSEFEELIDHDRAMFDEPEGWRNRKMKDSPLIVDFRSVWDALSSVYIKELSGLAYAGIPDSTEIGASMGDILKLFG